MVETKEIKEHVLLSLKPYWRQNDHFIKNLPIIPKETPTIKGPLNLVEIALPHWSKCWGVNGNILVPLEACQDDSAKWQSIDWWLAAFLLLECWHERIWEINRRSSIHSYSFRLKEWDSRMWDRAWVNRIALFLREWAANTQREKAVILFGPLPKPEILLTHDVDAVSKTMPIRIKQGAFNLFNSVKKLTKLNIKIAYRLFLKSLNLFFGREDWWKLDEVLFLEKNLRLTSIFHFYADKSPKNMMTWLFDPSYDIMDKRIVQFLQNLHQEGFEIGLHPSFSSWRKSALLANQRQTLMNAVKRPVSYSRQHWLRFSWIHTWRAQEEAGLNFDTTLMFNDRPGFRNAAAIAWKPKGYGQPLKILKAMPTVFMDSHFFDYQSMSDKQRENSISYWLNEVKSVHGSIAILWHPHTLSEDYGWKESFKYTLNLVKEINAKT